MTARFAAGASIVALGLLMIGLLLALVAVRNRIRRLEAHTGLWRVQGSPECPCGCELVALTPEQEAEDEELIAAFRRHLGLDPL